ncbi:alkaline shock response membrane anchor protein AmaP [Spirillospora sp. CA-294931]|uniref:alkaline shock response membrane anchor protein AmaP n=1 Tax=Spirillospora sp. CA-294931 TaxID=3240042 RepID=UPI003D9246B7
MDRHAARINRFGLTVTGLLLLAAGGAALALGLGAWGDRRRSEPVLADRTRDFAADNSWFWPAVAAAAVVVALFGLTWLLAQGRSERIRGLSLESDDREGATNLSGKALAEALEAEIEDFPGVRRAKARLLGTSQRPRLKINVSYGHSADLSALRRHIADNAMAHVRTALERDSVPTAVRLRLVAKDEERTVA